MDKKERYRQLCRKEKIPVFMQDWWADATSGEANWDVAVSMDKQGNIQAALVFLKARRYGFKMVTGPLLSPFSGIWIRYPEGMIKSAKRYSFEHKIAAELIEQLPPADFYNLNFHYSFKNALAFHWANFKTLQRYTYVIDDCSDPEKLFANLKAETRNRIKKARKIVQVECSDDIEQFYAINRQTFTRQDLNIHYSFEQLQQFDLQLRKRNKRKIYFAKDENNAIHAAAYIIFDDDAAYYFMGGTAPEFRPTRALFLLLWEAILEAGKRGIKFDFEGTMLPKVEPIFRSFGTQQQTYIRAEKSGKLFGIVKILSGK